MKITLEYKGEELEFDATIEPIHNGWIGSASGHGVYLSAVTGNTENSLIGNLKIAISQELMKQDGTFGKSNQD
ncbi:MAG: hypothetical protein ACOCRO_04900 [Halanaerobiales bacterium]